MVDCGSASKPRENKMPSDVVVCSERCACSGGGAFSSGDWPSSLDLTELCLLLVLSFPPDPYVIIWNENILQGFKVYRDLFRTPLVLLVFCVGTE